MQIQRHLKLAASMAVLLLISLAMLHAEVNPFSLAGVFGDNMVLQRDVIVPVWGQSQPNEKVTVEFAGQRKSATADANGQWMVKLDPMAVCAESRTLTVASTIKDHAARITNVLVGEVWLASGQSNMGWQLQRTPTTASLIPNANDPLLRLARIPHLYANEPQWDLQGCRWFACTPELGASFSAVAYVFGRDLRQSLKVPVGIVLASMPSSNAEAWTPMATLQAQPELRKSVEGYLTKAPISLEVPPAPTRPALLYNARIAPLTHLPIRGVIWYQAEGNSGNPELYETLFPAMIQSWRESFGRPSLPFLFVQLPPYKGTPPMMREVQARCEKNVPHTAMVVTLDLGEPENIHPANKEPVGARLALKARALVYGETLVHSGPELKSVERQGDILRVQFSHVAGGLQSRSGEPRGFEIAGADGKYFAAQAKIDGGEVTLSAPEVKAPESVRYAWANAPESDLFNRSGLPAAPFRMNLSSQGKKTR
jgi:sialate O-acetylesterase